MKIKTELPEVKVSFYPQRVESEQVYVKCSTEVYEVCLAIWDMDTIDLYEEFKVIYLDRRNGIIGYRLLSRGNGAATIVDVRMIFCIAVQMNTSSIILCHNHPSGHINPSQEDKRVTRKIAEAAKLFDLKLLDHLVVTRTKYFSFADEGLI